MCDLEEGLSVPNESALLTTSQLTPTRSCSSSVIPNLDIATGMRLVVVESDLSAMVLGVVYANAYGALSIIRCRWNAYTE